MSDYRFVADEEADFTNISSRKASLASSIDQRVQNEANCGKHYDKIKAKCSCYYDEFQEIYYEKCGYCGVPVCINSAPQYEVDHFVNKLQENTPEGKSVDHVENLIFACRNCNQAKKEFEINNILDLVHPDRENIKKVFKRDKYYKIIISQEYTDNEEIKSFYSKMKFNYAYRKLDYLLLNLYFAKKMKKMLK
ncbi:HNH endonuclease signature motif containing protein [Streptococcus sp. DD11]|uniref:HNH endonuclease signature motif containing protein n=1 Tax=Streptococcus sp. DD11 TaxID=1777879 RepID=UPI000A4397E0|nr:HNH endonuclease signature motif containing protein [Streptococcus sp. DD11]